MLASGYIGEVQLEGALNGADLSRLCKTKEAAHRAEIATAINDLIDFSAQRHRGSKIIFSRISEEEEADPENMIGRSGMDIKMALSVDMSKRALSICFSDRCDGLHLDTLSLRFSDIRAGLQPYRDLIEAHGHCRFLDLDMLAQWDKLRGKTHQDMLERMGFRFIAYGSAITCMLCLPLGRHIGTLICALFPKGPAEDWFLKGL